MSVWKKPPAIVVVLNVELAEIFNEVAARLVKKPLVEVTEVPVAVVKPKAPESVPPDNSR